MLCGLGWLDETEVAPRSGAWIEIKMLLYERKEIKSLPARGRGLKSYRSHHNQATLGRSPLGGVD